jgi:hypothetical protein
LRHRASPRFWALYDALPARVRVLADRSFESLKADPHHPSLHFKKIGSFWSVRIGQHYRALAVEIGGEMCWFWIGSHADYDSLISRL